MTIIAFALGVLVGALAVIGFIGYKLRNFKMM